MHKAKDQTQGQVLCEKCGCLWSKHYRFRVTHIVCGNEDCKCIHLCEKKKSESGSTKRKKRRTPGIIHKAIPDGEVSELYNSIAGIITGAVISCANDHPNMLLRDAASSISKRACRAITVIALQHLQKKLGFNFPKADSVYSN